MAFYPLRILDDNINRANRHTLGFIKMTHTFGTATRINPVNDLAFRNGLIGTFRFSDIAVDTFISNQ